MGDVMAGLGLVLLGIILFQMANTFFFYPARTDVNSGRVYFALKIAAFILFAAGAMFILMGYW